jgi:hypothetical protein
MEFVLFIKDLELMKNSTGFNSRVFKHNASFEHSINVKYQFL